MFEYQAKLFLTLMGVFIVGILERKEEGVLGENVLNDELMLSYLSWNGGMLFLALRIGIPHVHIHHAV